MCACACESLRVFVCVILDQLFSRIALYLKSNNAYDRKGILAAIEYGFSATQYVEPPFVQNLDRAANISEWITPYLAPTPHLTKFRQYKLEMVEGVVCVSARSRCAELQEFNEWRNLDGLPGSRPAQVPRLQKLQMSLCTTFMATC